MNNCALKTHVCTFKYFHVVPAPTVAVTAPDIQIVGRSLTLQCEVTTVRGITSRVDIVWSSGGMELKRSNGATSMTMGNLQVYIDSYTIPILMTMDKGRVIQCETVINTANTSIVAGDNITLDASSKFTHCILCIQAL